jgi:hypothetical protein
MPRKPKSKDAPTEPETPVTPIESYGTGKDLAAAIFRSCDVAKLAVNLLSGAKVSNGAVKARIWERLVEMYYGKQLPNPRRVEEEGDVEVIWDIAPLPTPEPQ